MDNNTMKVTLPSTQTGRTKIVLGSTQIGRMKIVLPAVTLPGGGTTTYIPSLDFSDSRNSQYLPIF